MRIRPPQCVAYYVLDFLQDFRSDYVLRFA